MNETNETTETSETSEATETHEATRLLYANLADIKRVVFAADALDKASAHIQALSVLCAANNIPVTFTFDVEAELPHGYLLAIIPQTETTVSDKGTTRVLSSVIVGALPDAHKILLSPAGAVWAVKVLTDKLIATLKAAVNKSINGESLPFTVDQFVATGKTSAFAGFNLVAREYVKALKQKSPQLSFLSVILLRQILSSAQFAEQQFPRIKQSNWVHIIDAMQDTCRLEGVDVGILAEWVKTRDAVEVALVDVSLDDIGDLVNAKHAESTEATKATEATAL